MSHYYLYQVSYGESETTRPNSASQLEPLQGSLADDSASLVAYWPPQATNDAYLIVEGRSQSSDVFVGRIGAFANADVALVDESADIEMALPPREDVCAGCGAEPPRHMEYCAFRGIRPPLQEPE